MSSKKKVSKKKSSKEILTEPVRMSFRVGINPRLRVRTKVEGETMTQQNLERETSIDFLMKRYLNTGLLPPRNENYGDQEPDFHDAMMTIAKVKTQFERLTPEEQAEVGNYQGLINQWFEQGEKAYTESIGEIKMQESDHPADTPKGGDEVTSEASPKTGEPG